MNRLNRMTTALPGLCTAAATVALLSACGSDAATTGSWAGTADTLASGQVVVHNTGDGVWGEGEEWRVVEELRIGRVDGEGPDIFGQINSFEIDDAGRFWIFDGQAQELRVFSASGEHLRTVGRRGNGPEEFAQAVKVERGPDGNIWVMDPQNNRLSVIDSSGVFVDSHHALGGFVILPWPGRFDDQGYYYSPVPQPGGERFRIGLLRSDLSFTSSDTLTVPTDPVDRKFLEHSSSPGSFVRSNVPFQGSLSWRLTPAGTFLALVTDEYRLFELDSAGDTLRTITRSFTPIPVTAEDRESARESLTWFTDQGGRFDPSELPRTKAPARSFFADDEGNIWVSVTTADPDESRYDIFGPDGRYRGAIELPFQLPGAPIVRDNVLYGVVRDEYEVSYLVRARIEKP